MHLSPGQSLSEDYFCQLKLIIQYLTSAAPREGGWHAPSSLSKGLLREQWGKHRAALHLILSITSPNTPERDGSGCCATSALPALGCLSQTKMAQQFCTSGHESGLRPREIAACRLLKEDAPRWLGNTSQQRMSLHTYIAELHARVQAFCVSQTNFASDYSLKFMLKKITITWLLASASALTKFISPWRSISLKRLSSHTQFSDVHFTDD